MVSPISSNAASGAAEPLGNTAASKLRQQDFLRLMVAQVKNLDPLNPDPNGEFLSQLAQFSTNDGINSMQASIEKLATSLQSNQALQASALVGRKVLVDSNSWSLGAEGDVKASINMEPGLSNLNARIYSQSGELIKTIPLNTPVDGVYEFSWDGTNQKNERAASGKYRVEVHASYNGRGVMVPTMTQANVDSVSLGQNGEGVKLNVAGVGSISLDQVKQISV
jgi:flagellar basal-body rod modification protein FlgD